MSDRLGEIVAVIDAMRRLYVQRCRVTADGFEVELHPLAFAQGLPDDSKPTESAPGPIGVENGGEPTEAQLLEWSTGQPLPKAS